MTTKKIIMSGMRPTGQMHLGHLSVLENWARLQKDYHCYYSIVDWHALTTSFDDTEEIRENIRQMAIDWLSVGIDPELSDIFVQSAVKEHAELHLLFSMIIPVSWLERVPTYKDQIRQFGSQGKDISTYGFLGYPLLQAADVLVYRADTVPVGEDQVPHIELTREVARRFNYMFRTDILPEPEALLAKIKMLPGTDNRKMSKSYNNYISLSSEPAQVLEKVQQMITDPARIRKNDPGHPDICTVYTYHGFYNQEEKEEISASCKAGTVGCFACKRRLAERIDQRLAPILAKRAELENNPNLITNILAQGEKNAAAAAAETLVLVREAMRI